MFDYPRSHNLDKTPFSRESFSSVNMIFTHMTLNDLNILFPTNLSHNFSYSFANHPTQYWFSVFCCPNDVKVNLKNRVRAVPVIAHSNNVAQIQC